MVKGLSLEKLEEKFRRKVEMSAEEWVKETVGASGKYIKYFSPHYALQVAVSLALDRAGISDPDMRQCIYNCIVARNRAKARELVSKMKAMEQIEKELQEQLRKMGIGELEREVKVIKVPTA